jgi:hypothetical protein
MKEWPRRIHWASRDRAPMLSACSHIVLLSAVIYVASVGLDGCGSASSVSGPGSGNNGQPQLSLSLSSVSFGSVSVGSSGSKSVTLTNSGAASLNLSQASIAGSGFTMSGITTPLKLSVGQTATLAVKFAPAQAGGASGSITLVSDAANSPTLISLTGTGMAPLTLQLSATPSSLSFGSVAVGGSGTQTVTLTNTGNSSLSIAQITVSGSGFSTTGTAPPSTLAAGQTAMLSIAFSPTSVSNFTGTVSVASNAVNSPATVSLTGAGVQASHWATLNWAASNSPGVSGYNAYRATQSGGSYTKVNTALITGTTYTDYSVESGQTYYYVVTAVNSEDIESVYSVQASTTIP